MKTIQTFIPMKHSYPASEHTYFLSLETTGLHPETSAIVMIGLASWDEDGIITTQYFNQTGMEQKEVLEAFFKDLPNNAFLITHYGNRFAIPFLTQKAEEFGLSNLLNFVTSIDYYDIIRPWRTLFGLSSCKQKSLETFFSCYRSVSLSGKKLVKKYQDYIKHPTQEALDLLCIHNQESLKILAKLSFLRTLDDIRFGHILHCDSKISKKSVVFSFSMDGDFPQEMSFSYRDIFLSLSGKNGILTLSIHPEKDSIHHYRTPIKDYYYLPVEDRVIHKSLASFVPKEYRQKATFDTCYEWIPSWHKALSKESDCISLIQDTISYLLSVKL